jgi:plastocyanin
MKSFALLGLAGLLALTPVAPTSEADQEVLVLAYFRQFTPPVVVVPHGTAVTFDSPALVGNMRHTFTTATSLGGALAGQATDTNDTNCRVDGEPGEDGSADTCDVNLPAGTTFTHTFAATGDYWYYCSVHVSTSMIGLVRVV